MLILSLFIFILRVVVIERKTIVSRAKNAFRLFVLFVFFFSECAKSPK